MVMTSGWGSESRVEIPTPKATFYPMLQEKFQKKIIPSQNHIVPFMTKSRKAYHKN